MSIRGAQVETGICCHAGTYNTHQMKKRMFENGPVIVQAVPLFLLSCEVKLNLNATVAENAEIYVFDTNLPQASLTSVMAVINAGGKAVCISDGKVAGGIFSWDPVVEAMAKTLVQSMRGTTREVFEMLSRPVTYGLAFALVEPTTGAVIVGDGDDDSGLDQLMWVDARFLFANQVLA